MAIKKKVCLICGGEDLRGRVVLERFLPISSRGDSVKVSSKEANVTAVDLKRAWTETEEGAEKRVRGPIYCMDCGAVHEYHKDGGALHLVEEEDGLD